MLAYYGPRPNGTWGEIRESAHTDDEEKARKVLERKIREVRSYREGLLQEFEGPTQRRTTVAALLDDLSREYEKKQIKGLRVALTRIKEGSALRTALGHKRASSLTSADVNRYVLDRRAAGKANATINREIELLRRALRLGQRNRRIMRLPEMPERLPEKNARQGFFETDEFLALLPHLVSPLDDVARFAFRTGWRRGEILGLSWEMVDRATGEIRLPDTKSGKPRSLPLDDELAGIIDRRWEARQFATRDGAALAGLVFHRNGRPIHPDVFRRQWNAACDAAGLHGKLFHDFRRTAARNMIRGGVPQSVAMRITGHETDSMFRRYDISSSADKLAALRAARTYADSRKGQTPNVVGLDGQPRVP